MGGKNSPAAHRISSQFKHNITTSKNNESRFDLSKDISRAYSDNKGGLASRRKSHGAMININASHKNINAIALAVGKKINPLPPIEQYQTYQTISKHPNHTLSGNFVTTETGGATIANRGTTMNLPVKKQQQKLAQGGANSLAQ